MISNVWASGVVLSSINGAFHICSVITVKRAPQISNLARIAVS